VVPDSLGDSGRGDSDGAGRQDDGEKDCGVADRSVDGHGRTSFFGHGLVDALAAANS
jgi:hypothetical protein